MADLRFSDDAIIRSEWDAIHRAEDDERARAHGYYNAPLYEDELAPLDDWASDAWSTSKCVVCGQVYDKYELPSMHNRFHMTDHEGGKCAYAKRSRIG